MPDSGGPRYVNGRLRRPPTDNGVSPLAGDGSAGTTTGNVPHSEYPWGWAGEDTMSAHSRMEAGQGRRRQVGVRDAPPSFET